MVSAHDGLPCRCEPRQSRGMASVLGRMQPAVIAGHDRALTEAPDDVPLYLARQRFPGP